jgi:hypothetical protein
MGMWRIYSDPDPQGAPERENVIITSRHSTMLQNNGGLKYQPLGYLYKIPDKMIPVAVA